jgi:hypothetical protein
MRGSIVTKKGSTVNHQTQYLHKQAHPLLKISMRFFIHMILKKKMTRLFAVLFYFMFISVSALVAQVSKEPNLINPIPPSPNAASLGAFGNTPISLYTGKANVSIPFFTISQDNFSMPISLGYNGGGVKVEEIASHVGLGWTLNAGGVVTRTVFGKDDFGANGFQTTPYAIPTDLPTDQGSLANFTESQSQMLWDFAKQNHDSEPDVFYFNFAGHSGKFVIDKNGDKHIIPHQKLKITGGNTGWIITTEDGIEFQFGAKEYHQSKQYTQTNSSETSAPVENFISSWYLNKIKFPNSSKSIDFNYTIDSNLTYWESGNNETKHFREFYPDAEKNVVSYCKNWVSTVYLSSIIFENGEIHFDLGNERCDLTGSKVLQEIEIKNKSSEVVKRFSFGYTYNGWTGSDAVTSDCDDFQGSDASLRLVLKEITEADGEGILKKPPYRFDYYEGTLPSRRSTSQDYWGYYNGRNNSTLIPDATLPGVVNGPLYTNFGTNRNPDFQYAKMGALKTIEYPTGGSTAFEYEPHYVHPNEYMELPDEIIGRDQSLTIDVTNTNLSTYIESLPFTVNKNTTGTFQFAGSLNSTCTGCDYIRWLLWKQQPNGSFINIWTGYNFTMAPGNGSASLVKDGVYKFSHEILTNMTTYRQVMLYGYSLRLKWTETNPSQPLTLAGGIRISKIADYDPVTNRRNVRIFEYRQDADGQYSGYVLSSPKFYIDYYTKDNAPGGGGVQIRNYYILTSTNNYPLSTTQGSYIGYSEVSEYAGIEDLNQKQNANGKITYKYHAPDEIKDLLPTRNNAIQGQEYVGFPYGNVISQDWKRGLLKEQIVFSQNAAVFKEVKKTNYNYTFVDKANMNSNYSSVVGFKAAISTDFAIGDEVVRFTSGTKFKWGYYRYESGYPILNSIVEKTYDQNDLSKIIEKTTSYTYNLNNLQVAEEQSNIGTENKIVAYTYPKDYEDQTGFIKKLVDANIINVPIETVRYRSDIDGSNKEILDGQVSIYDDAGKSLLEKIQILETRVAIQLSAFKFSNQPDPGTLPSNTIRSVFSPDSRYKERITYSYDGTTNKIKSIQTNKDSKQILWGYNNSLPIAEIVNPGSGSNYYTSFEENGISFTNSNGDNLAKTGKKVYQGPYSFPAEIIDTGGLKMSYWYHDGTNWIFSGVVSYSPTIASSDEVDEVRVFSPNAVMTTYTYEPLFGQTSICDSNNVVTYFEYDSLGRLSVVKDDKGDIVKTYNYHYKGQ